MFGFSLREQLNKKARKKSTENARDSSIKKIHIIIVQDNGQVQSCARSIGKLLNNNSRQLTTEEFIFGSDLEKYLKNIKDDKTIIPDTFILDSGGAGSKLGVFIAKWFDEHRPDAPLPTINFLSMATCAALNDSASLKAKDPRIETDYIDFEELLDLKKSLKKFSFFKNQKIEATTKSFRKLLNNRLETNLPLEVETEEHNKHKMMYDTRLKDALLERYEAGKSDPSAVINYWRKYTVDLAKSLQSGLYNMQHDDIKTDASFYEGTGLPVKGAAVFSLKEVEDWSINRQDKPILIMQSFDPKVVPLLDTGKLGGIVLCGPYLAAHLSMLCEANKISGVFGLVPPDSDGLSSDFNEMSKSHLAPYFAKKETEIDGVTIKAGQNIIIGVGDNGIAFKIGTISQIQEKLDQQKEIKPLSLNASSDLEKINTCFKDFFSEHKMKPHKIKANADSIQNSLLKSASGIGLIRTEQIAGSCEHQSKALRNILLDDDPNSYDGLSLFSGLAYSNFFNEIKKGYPVKIRLFDISPAELLNIDDQKKFHEKYKTMDIHGGRALETWSRLYQEQVRTIVSTYQKTLEWNTNPSPIQIMMPAIRTEKETLHIKGIIEEEAKKSQLLKCDYQFGVMIETIDSCDNAANITKHCDFISFGTNDLTQQVLNIPRGDLIIRKRYEKEHGFDPYKKLAPEVLDRIRNVCTIARKVNPKIEIDICGGQASDLDTAQTLFDAGVDNLSVAPSQANLIALPLLLNYQMFDKTQKQPVIKATIPKQGLTSAVANTM